MRQKHLSILMMGIAGFGLGYSWATFFLRGGLFWIGGILYGYLFLKMWECYRQDCEEACDE